jgi:hypothetical protein
MDENELKKRLDEDLSGHVLAKVAKRLCDELIEADAAALLEEHGIDKEKALISIIRFYENIFEISDIRRKIFELEAEMEDLGCSKHSDGWLIVTKNDAEGKSRKVQIDEDLGLLRGLARDEEKCFEKLKTNFESLLGVIRELGLIGRPSGEEARSS